MIKTQRLRLEPLTRDHASAVFSDLSNPLLYQFIWEEPPDSRESLATRYGFLEGGKSPDGRELWLNWIACLIGTSTPIGHFQATVRPGQYADIAYMVFADHQRQGYGQEMVRAMTPYLMQEYSLDWIQAEIDQDNKASLRLMESVGFQRSVFTIDACEYKGRRHNEYRFIKTNQPADSSSFFVSLAEKMAAPWFDCFGPVLNHLREKNAFGTPIQSLDRLAQTSSGDERGPFRFVALEGRLKARDYHQHIVENHEVPMHADRQHDIMNALVWLSYPRLKSQLMKWHFLAAQNRCATDPNRRTPEEDALSHFDESGIIVISSDPQVLRAIKNFEWKSLFWNHRQTLLMSTEVYVFGHGLLEKSLRPYIGLTGHALLQVVPQSLLSQRTEVKLKAIDERLSDRIEAGHGLNKARDLHPFPMLGMPGWWPETEDCEFYDNTQYFRERRRR